MQIVSEKNLAHFLELKAKNAKVDDSTLASSLKSLCFVYDECEANYENAYLDNYENFDEYFINNAKLVDGYFQVGKFIKAVNYKQLNNLANQCANYFKELGLKQGDKLGLMVYNSFEFAISFFASFKLGLVLVPINALFAYDDAKYIIDKTKLSYIVLEKEFQENFKLDINTIIKENLLENIKNKSKEFKTGISNCDDLAMVLFTSGTTSKPKGCKLTHYNLLYASHFTSAQIGLRNGDIFVTSMPNWHIDLLATAFMPSLRVNARFVLFNRFSARRFWQQLVFFKANISEVVPKMIEVIKLQKPFLREDKHSLRFLLYFLNMSDKKYLEFKARFKTDLFTSYGLSESIVGIIGDNHYEEFKFGKLGRVYFGVDVIIANRKDNKLIPLKANEIGEICIKARMGKEIFAGYYEDEETTKKAFCDGYFLTKDLGFYDEEGLFYFYSRNKDLIKINGENVSAIELENKLCEHKAVKNACIIAACDDISCDLIIAIVELNNNEGINYKQDSKDLMSAILDENLKNLKKDILKINNNLTNFKRIRDIIFVKNLPYNHIGKVCKNILGEVYGRI